MKERLDVIMVNQGCAGSRSRARDLILSGKVFVNGRKADKAGSFYDSSDVEIKIAGDELRYVSRGGLKLEKALEKWQIVLKDMVCADVGASTGGFTDCMLQNGAAKVYSVDVGHGQLAEKLRHDQRVINMEGTNFRYLSGEELGEEPDFISADVSFISLTKILTSAAGLLREGGQMVCLIKPQFEAGRGNVGKNGVVKDRKMHCRVIAGIMEFAVTSGFKVLHLDYSPVRGPEGNIEYLLHLENSGRPAAEVIAGAEAQAGAAVPQVGTEALWGRQEKGNGEALCGTDWKSLIENTVEAAWKAL